MAKYPIKLKLKEMEKKFKYLYLFDYNVGRIVEILISDFKDPEEEIEANGFNLDEISWMISNVKLKIEQFL